MIAQIVNIGGNAELIILSCAGVFGLYLFIAIVAMGVESIKRFLDIS